MDVVRANGISKVSGQWRQAARGQLLHISVRGGGRLVLEAQHSPGALLLRPTGESTWDAIADPSADSKVFYVVQLLSAELLQLMRPGKSEEVPAQFTRATPPPLTPYGSLPPLRPPVQLSAAPGPRPGGADRSQSHSPDRGADSAGPLEGGSGDGTLRDQLIAKVKARQSSSAAVNQRWREHCQSEGRGIFDPRRHDARFLQSFLDKEARVDAREGEGGQPSDARSSASRSPDRESGGARARRASRSRRRGRLGRRRSPRKKERGRRRQGDKHRRGERKRRQGRKHASRKQRSPQASTGSGSGDSMSESGDDAGSAGSSVDKLASPHLLAPAGGGPDGTEVDAQAAAQRVAAEALLAECERSLAAAKQARHDAEKALADEREHLQEEVEARVQGERKRQQMNMARRIEEAEHSAKLEEEERIREFVRQAAEEREAKVRDVRRAAEEDMRQAVMGMERAAHNEMSSRLRAAEDRMRDANDRVNRAMFALDDAKASKAKHRSFGLPEPQRGGVGRRRGASVSTGSQHSKAGQPKRRRDGSVSSASGSSSSSEGGDGGRASRRGGRRKMRKKA